ncbi:MAG: hypothetical protein ACREQN_08200 [Candidatus Binataceae bacterium]
MDSLALDNYLRGNRAPGLARDRFDGSPLVDVRVGVMLPIDGGFNRAGRNPAELTRNC